MEGVFGSTCLGLEFHIIIVLSNFLLRLECASCILNTALKGKFYKLLVRLTLSIIGSCYKCSLMLNKPGMFSVYYAAS